MMSFINMPADTYTGFNRDQRAKLGKFVTPFHRLAAKEAHHRMKRKLSETSTNDSDDETIEKSSDNQSDIEKFSSGWRIVLDLKAWEAGLLKAQANIGSDWDSRCWEIVSDVESMDSESDSDYSSPSKPASPTSFSGEPTVFSPFANPFVSLPDTAEDIHEQCFNELLLSAFAELDVEALVADPGPTLLCNDGIRGYTFGDTCQFSPILYQPVTGCNDIWYNDANEDQNYDLYENHQVYDSNKEYNPRVSGILHELREWMETRDQKKLDEIFNEMMLEENMLEEYRKIERDIIHEEEDIESRGIPSHPYDEDCSCEMCSDYSSWQFWNRDENYCKVV